MSVISPNIENMKKGRTYSGGPSFNCGDEVATMLLGQPVEVVKAIAQELNMDPDKYNHLNNGQIKMTLSNRFRKQVRTWDADPDRQESGIDTLYRIAQPHLLDLTEGEGEGESEAA